MRHRDAAAVCAAVCLAVLGALAIPYLVTNPESVAVYYRAPLAGVRFAGVLTLLVLLALVLGYAGRVDRTVLAAVIVVLGGYAFLITVWWAVTLSPHVAMELSTADEFAYHRWLLVGLTLLVPLAGLWYARSVRRATRTRAVEA
ncbi:DUF7548 family protein [Haladaptatus salinisoli]|uniref:DUF7548 family protein n=1 Tax=Haladaptatus salinisoli TaxID=2884876 RepID=UPI001D09D11E|nr:hypothetical protein [Haladaptatus salinisoli]